MEFEFNFGSQTVSKGIKAGQELYASVSGVVLTLSSEELVFMNKETGENHVMTHQVLHALSLCQNFRPLSQHIYNISQSIPELKNQTQAIEKVADFLIKNKLLIEDKDWIVQISESQESMAVQSAGLVIRTCDRPGQLKRMLQSLVKYQEKFGINHPIQVYDDSTTEKKEKEIETVCKEFAGLVKISFYGKTWQSQFVNMLKNEFTESINEIDWLLQRNNDGFTGGRVWNFALLNNAGKKFLFYDDDYIFEPRIIEESKSVDLDGRLGLSVGFANNLSEIRDSSREYDRDVLSEMLDTCGKSVGNWLTESNLEINSVESLNLLELQRIDNSSIIKFTGNGTWGSPRSDSNYWLYNLDENQKQEFWKSRENYLDNIEASNLMHYTENYEFLGLTKFSPSAIDNSTLMPFAFPVERVEDHFFNAVSLFCYPNQVSLHYPFMMGHIQNSKRDRANSNHIAIKPNFNKFIADFSLTLLDSTDAKDPVLRMKTLSKYILGLADSSDENIHNRLKEYLSQMRSDVILSMQEQMRKSPDAPVYWQADVREIVEANGKAIIQNGVPVLNGWGDNLSKEECVNMARKKITDVARAMELWPELWSFCQVNK